MKADDIITMPLCRTCHDKMHKEPSLWPDQWRMIALTLADAVKEGFFK